MLSVGSKVLDALIALTTKIQNRKKNEQIQNDKGMLKVKKKKHQFDLYIVLYLHVNRLIKDIHTEWIHYLLLLHFINAHH